MNFRDRLMWEEQREESIKFDFSGDGADVDVKCSRGNVVMFMYNIIKVASSMAAKIELTEEEKSKIIKNWKQEIKDFTK